MGDALEDRDHDHVDNGNEAREGTRPDRKDTDRDHKRDGKEDADHDHLNNAAEDQTGNDPIDEDTDGDGTLDGDEIAGEIVSFSNHVLTIALYSGDKLRGLVTVDTEIYCDNEDGYESSDDAGRGADGGEGDWLAAALSDRGDGPGAPGPGPPGTGDPGDGGSDQPGDGGSGGPDDGGSGDSTDDGWGETDDSGGDCGPEALVSGTVVHEADLSVDSEGATFTEVDLIAGD